MNSKSNKNQCDSNSFIFKVATSKQDFLNLASVGIANHLYVKESWCIYSFLTDLIRRYTSDIERKQLRISHYYWTNNHVKYKRPKNIIIIAYQKEKPIAILTCEKFIINFYVLPEWRRKGVASALWKKACEEFNFSTKALNLGTDDAAYCFQQKMNFPGI